MTLAPADPSTLLAPATRPNIKARRDFDRRLVCMAKAVLASPPGEYLAILLDRAREALFLEQLRVLAVAAGRSLDSTGQRHRVGDRQLVILISTDVRIGYAKTGVQVPGWSAALVFVDPGVVEREYRSILELLVRHDDA